MGKKATGKTRQHHFIDVAPMVRQIQRQTGLSQNKTAELIGVSWMTVSLWLRGTAARPPYAAMVERALKDLNSQSKAA